MIYLERLERRPPLGNAEVAYPFGVSSIAALRELDFSADITFFVGENGSGKSTLIEALAIASQRPAIGERNPDIDPSLDPVRPLAESLRLRWKKRTARGFFLRAEDFFNFSKRNRAIESEMHGYAEEASSPQQKAFFLGQAHAMRTRYDGDIQNRSHGEGFLQVFRSRIVPGGLYLIDEPEAAFSPSRQLAFLSLIKQAVADRCQFVIATHSPIILSYPGAAIWSFDTGEIRSAEYEQLEHVRLTRDFLASPDRYWRHL